MNYQELQHYLQHGDLAAARHWLDQNPNPQDPMYNYYVALVAEQPSIEKWKTAIAFLDAYPGSSAMIQAYQSIIKLLNDGEAHDKERIWLKRLLDQSKEKIHPLHYLELQSQYANRLLLDGYEPEATILLEEILEQAILHKSHLIIIAQGIILTSLWMKKGRFMEAASLAVSIEESAKERHNWLALSCGSMIRATCWRTQGMIPQSIGLLMETGNFLYERGAVAALNLIRARLTEFRVQMGDDWEVLTQ